MEKQTTHASQSKTVTVFGGWKVTPKEDIYKQAVRLGQFLTRNGFDVKSGGQEGIMEAISEGAAIGNAERVAQNQAPQKIEGVVILDYWSDHSKHLTSVIDKKNLGDRTEALCQNTELFVLFPGQKGTMLELWYIFNMRHMSQTNGNVSAEYAKKDILIFREPWHKILSQASEMLQLEKQELNYFTFVDSVEDIIKFISDKYKLQH